MFVTRDGDIRKLLLSDLRKKYCDPEHDLILEEFGCNTARTDVAVVNGSLHAFEIKSDSDSLERLSAQIEAYQGVYEYITLVCGSRLMAKASEQIPIWWGLKLAELKDGAISLEEVRDPKMNPKQNGLSLARMLWKTEAIRCIRKYGYKKGVTAENSADEIAQFAADHLPVHILCAEVRDAIKARGGSGFAKKSVPDDGSYTTESTALPDRSSGLEWLLSQQYQHPLG